MLRPGFGKPAPVGSAERLVSAEMARFGSDRPARPRAAAAPAFAITVAAVAWAASACSGNSSVPVHGEVFKTVGRPCALLSAAFPAVGHRIVTFLDPVGSELGRTVTGAARERPIGS